MRHVQLPVRRCRLLISFCKKLSLSYRTKLTGRSSFWRDQFRPVLRFECARPAVIEILCACMRQGRMQKKIGGGLLKSQSPKAPILRRRRHRGVETVVVVVLSNVDVGDPRCPIHGDDAIFTHKF